MYIFILQFKSHIYFFYCVEQRFYISKPMISSNRNIKISLKIYLHLKDLKIYIIQIPIVFLPQNITQKEEKLHLEKKKKSISTNLIYDKYR